MNDFLNFSSHRRTFAIISHPDAGKTTITEKLLLFGGAIQLAGTIKGRKSARYATSDWMTLEKDRGISVTTSVMQFSYGNRLFNLLDTPGHEDFSEDTYRTLTAVDSALMIVDPVKGVEERTIKLMEVCRLRNTPIISFINKLDRESRVPIELIDEVEHLLKIQCVPMTWPIGSGKRFRGIYHLHNDTICLYQPGQGDRIQTGKIIFGLDNIELDRLIGLDLAHEFRDEVKLVKGACHSFDLEAYIRGKLMPVYFGSALNNFGVRELLDAFVDYAPSPRSRLTNTREVKPEESKFSGFVFKIQANMDPQHRDRIAFLRICSGKYQKGMKLRHLRIGRDVQISNALTFMAGEREHITEALPGDIIGLHNHGTIRIGDTFTEGEELKFIGIPNFAPELFRAVRPKNPLKMKALQKGLVQLSEEGAAQIFKPINDNKIILGAVGMLQFDVVSHRLIHEYNVTCLYDSITIAAVRWVSCEDSKQLLRFERKLQNNLAFDAGSYLVYLAPSIVNLQLTQERWPDIIFNETRDL